MYMRAPYQNMDLQAMRSSMWYPVPLAPQEPNLNFLLMMIQMMSHMRKFQYQPMSAPNFQDPVELDIESVILGSQQRNLVMDEMVKRQVPRKYTVIFGSEKPDEREIYEVSPPEEEQVQQNIQKFTRSFEEKEKDAILKWTKEKVEHLTAENERLKNEIEIAQEELKSCRKNKEEEIKCNSIDNLHQVTVLGPLLGCYSFALNQSFRPGSKVVIRGRAENTAPRLHFNFKYPEGIAFHLDNRWDFHSSKNVTVMNTYSNIKDSWGQEVYVTSAPIKRGQDFVLSVQSEEEEFKICVNGSPFATYSHRVHPGLITAMDINGAAEITSVYYQGVEGHESTEEYNSSPSDQDELNKLLHAELINKLFGED